MVDAAIVLTWIEKQSNDHGEASIHGIDICKLSALPAFKWTKSIHKSLKWTPAIVHSPCEQARRNLPLKLQRISFCVAESRVYNYNELISKRSSLSCFKLRSRLVQFRPWECLHCGLSISLALSISYEHFKLCRSRYTYVGNQEPSTNTYMFMQREQSEWVTKGFGATFMNALRYKKDKFPQNSAFISSCFHTFATEKYDGNTIDVGLVEDFATFVE